MRIVLTGVTLAVLGAATFAAAPAGAQGVYIEGPGVSVGVGPRDHYRERDWDRRRHYEERYSRRDCRTVTVRHDDGSVRQTRRCD